MIPEGCFPVYSQIRSDAYHAGICQIFIYLKVFGSGNFLFSRNGVATPGHPRIPEQFEMAREMADYIENVLGVYKNK